MPRRRLGVVVLLPADVRDQVDALRLALGDDSLGKVPAHVTLVPPVNVREDDIEGGLASLRDVAARTQPFGLIVGPPATFLPDTPVCYLRVGGDVDALIALKDAVFRPPFARRVDWPFVPHVTLRDGAPDDRTDAAVTALADFRGSFPVERVHVLQGEHGVWGPIADFAFGGVAVRGRGSLDLEVAESDVPDPEAREFAARAWRAHDEARFGPGTRWERHPFALTARRDGRVAGVATGWTGLGVGYLSELVVADDARGQGIGSHLLASFESLAAQRGCARLALRTDAGSRAVGFYERHGWRVEATFTEWLGGADFVQMRRDV